MPCGYSCGLGDISRLSIPSLNLPNPPLLDFTVEQVNPRISLRRLFSNYFLKNSILALLLKGATFFAMILTRYLPIGRLFQIFSLFNHKRINHGKRIASLLSRDLIIYLSLLICLGGQIWKLLRQK
jgi:hypothetical protein